ncbi:MAG: response regulator [Marinirhabdus sp.]|nr:response regulator [Marinirhabdus sp.]
MKKSVLVFCTMLIATCVTSVFAQQDRTKDTLRVLFETLKDSSETYYTLADYKRSMEVNVKILNTAFEIGDPVLIHKGYRFLAYDYLALQDLGNAEENLKKSERYAKQSKNDTAVALTHMDLANLFAFEEDGFEKSMKYHKMSIDGFRQIKDTAGLAKAHYNAVVTAFNFEEYQKGLFHLLQAEKFGKTHSPKAYMAGIENFYGDFYLHRKKYKKAEKSYLEAIEIGKEYNLSGDLESSYYGYSYALYHQNRFKESMAAREKYEEYLLKNIEVETSAATGTTSSKFQLSEYQKMAEAARQKNVLQAELMTTKSRTNTFLWFLSGIGLLLAGYLWYAYRHRKQLVRELQIKNKEYLHAKEESEKLARAKAKFFSTVSHELRTPLYGVIGLSTILMENEDLKRHEKDLKSLKFSADYLLALINDVLQINKIDNQNYTEEATAFNLKELIGTIVSSFEYMRIQHNNEININIDPGMPLLFKGSSVRLSQVLMNLIGNACKFTEDGTIDINTQIVSRGEKTAMIQFTVKDTGMGIAKNKLDSIFNEFSQIEHVNQNYQGTGLGLPIVKKLLQQANSEISVMSEIGKGSTFTFSLLFDVLEQNAEKETIAHIDTNEMASKRILIVEDNRINQTVTKKILEKDGVYCEIAENGEEAIQKVQQTSFDLILMDINMPVKNGIEATVEIRKFNTTIPIIALTAVEVEDIRYRIFECGMNDIIVKPYDVTKFRQTIAKNLVVLNTLPATPLKAM